MIKERNIVTQILLTIITCGIYGIIWFISLTDDARFVSGDERLSGGKALLFTLITCGIYGYFWSYQMGKAISQAQAKNGQIVSDNSVLFVVLQLFGLGIVNYCIMQSDLNKFATQQPSAQ